MSCQNTAIPATPVSSHIPSSALQSTMEKQKNSALVSPPLERQQSFRAANLDLSLTQTRIDYWFECMDHANALLSKSDELPSPREHQSSFTTVPSGPDNPRQMDDVVIDTASEDNDTIAYSVHDCLEEDDDGVGNNNRDDLDDLEDHGDTAISLADTAPYSVHDIQQDAPGTPNTAIAAEDSDVEWLGDLFSTPPRLSTQHERSTLRGTDSLDVLDLADLFSEPNSPHHHDTPTRDPVDPYVLVCRSYDGSFDPDQPMFLSDDDISDTHSVVINSQASTPVIGSPIYAPELEPQDSLLSMASWSSLSTLEPSQGSLREDSHIRRPIKPQATMDHFARVTKRNIRPAEKSPQKRLSASLTRCPTANTQPLLKDKKSRPIFFSP